MSVKLKKIYNVLVKNMEREKMRARNKFHILLDNKKVYSCFYQNLVIQNIQENKLYIFCLI